MSDRQLTQILNAVLRHASGGRRAPAGELGRIAKSFGPLGELVAAVADVFSGSRARPTHFDVADAINVLKEFGYEITPGGPSTGDPPISRPPRSNTPPRSPGTVPPVGTVPPPGSRPNRPPPLPSSRPGTRPPPIWQPEGTIDTRIITPQFASEEIETPESSNVFAYSFDHDVGILYVTYKAAGPLTSERSASGYLKRPHVRGPTYAYGGRGRPVPESLLRAMAVDDSKGGFVWENLRIRGTIHGHKYPYMLTAGELRSSDGNKYFYVPRKATAKGFRVRTVAYVDTPAGSGYQESQLPERLRGR